LGFLEQPNDLSQLRVRADPCRFDEQTAVAIQGSADHFGTGADVERNRLAGQHREVERRRAFANDSVDRDLFARQHQDKGANGHLFDGNAAFVLALENCRLLRSALDECACCVACVCPGAGLEHLPKKDQRDDDRCGVEVVVVAASDDGPRTVGEGRERAHRDQRVHCGGPVTGRLHGGANERPAGIELNRDRQQPGEPHAPAGVRHDEREPQDGEGEQHRHSETSQVVAALIPR
jgi:hypothetical protein